MIGMNGHGYSSSGRSEDANAGILEGVEELQEEECEMEHCRCNPKGARAHRARVMFTLNSLDLRMWSSMISSRIISFQKVMVKPRQVLHPFRTL
jgi:hypothetical protein